MYNTPIYCGSLINVIAGKLFDPYFISYSWVWIVIHLFRLWKYPIPFFNGWLTDFCFVPVCCHIALTVTRFIIVRDKTYCYPLLYILFVASYVTVLFEMVIPDYSGFGTGDVWDGVTYFAGAAFFYFIHQNNVFVQTKAALR